MRCSKCGTENTQEANFCPKCGAKFVPREDIAVANDPGAFYCFKHKREVTRVTCGKCEKPVCTKCMVIGSAGVRCQECARNKVATRWRGVAHDLGSGIGRVDGRKVWYLYIAAMIARMFGGWFR
jgi:hypothetical protein